MESEEFTVFRLEKHIRFVTSVNTLHIYVITITAVSFLMNRFGVFYPSSARVRASSPGRGMRAPRNCSSPRHMRGAQDRVSQLKEIIDKLMIEYEPLRTRVEHLSNAATDETAARLTMQDFKVDLNKLEEMIEKRRKKLIGLEKQVLIFRRAEDSTVARPRLQDTLMPTRRKQLAPLPSLTDQKSKASIEYQELKNKTLYYERLIILRKLQLKMLHDHRDLDQLRNNFNNLGDDDDEESACNDLRRKCQALKLAIGYEQDRITVERSPYVDEYFAAVAIQSAWRGYSFRKKCMSK